MFPSCNIDQKDTNRHDRFGSGTRPEGDQKYLELNKLPTRPKVTYLKYLWNAGMGTAS